MTCCILGLLMVAAIGRIRRVFGVRRVRAPDLFAPVARRPAPGQTLPVSPVLDTGQGQDQDHSAPTRSAVLGYCAFGIALVLVGAPALMTTGLVSNTGAAGNWLLRNGCYLAAVAAAFALRRSTTIWCGPRGAGPALVIVGTVIFELSVLDMHVFRVIAIDSANMLQMFVFHNIGPLVAIIGGAALGYGSLGRSSTSWRSSRSMDTSAQPASSAVTMVSSPPLTW